MDYNEIWFSSSTTQEEINMCHAGRSVIDEGPNAEFCCNSLFLAFLSRASKI